VVHGCTVYGAKDAIDQSFLKYFLRHITAGSSDLSFGIEKNKCYKLTRKAGMPVLYKKG
jgi:hypothetical protein